MDSPQSLNPLAARTGVATNVPCVVKRDLFCCEQVDFVREERITPSAFPRSETNQCDLSGFLCRFSEHPICNWVLMPVSASGD
jgi:hypothetical protein